MTPLPVVPRRSVRASLVLQATGALLLLPMLCPHAPSLPFFVKSDSDDERDTPLPRTDSPEPWEHDATASVSMALQHASSSFEFAFSASLGAQCSLHDAILRPDVPLWLEAMLLESVCARSCWHLGAHRPYRVGHRQQSRHTNSGQSTKKNSQPKEGTESPLHKDADTYIQEERE